MSSPTRASTSVRGRTGRLLGTAVALSLLSASALLAPPAALADSSVAAKSGSFTIRGAGFGHGHGMSQYGAYGAARQGLSWKQILAFYYPKTTVSAMPSGTTIKVWLTADSDNDLRVKPAAGLKLSDASGHSYLLPTGPAYTGWRVTRSGSGYRLSYRTTSGSYKVQTTPLSDSTWSFSSSAKVLTLTLPSGGNKQYRGSLALVKRGSGGRTVNTVLLEDYVRAVVPVEMPTSWLADAVRVQAVAARSYAVRTRDFSDYSGYDICDTSTCQVYGGKSRENAAGNAAVKATAGAVLTYQGKVALTQFASSNGGALAAGNLPYLVGKPDPYDGVVTSQAWTRTIKASAIATAWPSVGTVQKLQVTSRDGSGSWGGRVEKITITGSKGSVTVAGSTFQYRFGLRSSLYTVVGPTGGGTTPPAVQPPGRPWATFPRSYDAASPLDVLILSGGTLSRYPVVGTALKTPVSLGTGFGGYDQLVNVGDWNGDGYQDLVSRATSGALRLHRGTGTGRFATGVAMGFGTGLRAVTGVGDVNGDRRPDLAVVSRAGNLWFYYGNGATGRAGRLLVAGGWQSQDALRGPGDLTGDGRPDLLSVDGDRLYLHRGTAAGLAKRVSLGSGWGKYAALTAAGDVDGDGRNDLLGRTSTGGLVLFRGDGKGGLSAATSLAGNYRGTRFVV
ncbi:MAG: SpoIID/LytB domain-containing protein [Friedmanniella sp.]